MELFEMNKERQQMCELFFELWKWGKDKSTQRLYLLFIILSTLKGSSHNEGSIVVEHWLREEQRLHLLEGCTSFSERVLSCQGALSDCWSAGAVAAQGRAKDSHEK